MLIALIIFSLVFLGLIIFIAFSPKTAKPVKRTALIALAVIGLSIVICTILLILGPGKEQGDIPLPVLQDTTPQSESSGNVAAVIMFIAVFLLVMAAIIVLSLRKERKKNVTGKKAGKSRTREDENFGFEYAGKEGAGDGNKSHGAESFDDKSLDDESFEIEK